MELTSSQKQYLKGLGHQLQPLVFVGQRGITENLLENVEQCLLSHELVKIKVHDSDELPQAKDAILESSGALLVQKIGKTLLIFRPHPKDPQISLPK